MNTCLKRSKSTVFKRTLTSSCLPLDNTCCTYSSKSALLDKSREILGFRNQNNFLFGEMFTGYSFCGQKGQLPLLGHAPFKKGVDPFSFSIISLWFIHFYDLSDMIRFFPKTSLIFSRVLTVGLHLRGFSNF